MILPDTLKNKHLLVVDDVASMRNMTKTVLRSAGFNKIQEAQDGVIALSLLKIKPVDLVICDWTMPNMNGLELFKACAANEKLKNIPFLMLTGSSDIKKVKEAISAGVTDYIVKPYKQDDFIGKIVSKF